MCSSKVSITSMKEIYIQNKIILTKKMAFLNGSKEIILRFVQNIASDSWKYTKMYVTRYNISSIIVRIILR